MATQATVQGKVNFGYGKAASILGAPNSQYRPNGATNPIVAGNLIGMVTVLYDTAADMMQRQPSKREKPDDWFGAFDRTGVLAGDYFVDPTLGTFFVASMEFFRPARMVRCNRVVSVGRPNPNPPGASFYGGDQTAQETPILTAWPAAEIQGTKGEKSVTSLPGDVRAPWIEVLLPASAPTVEFDDVLSDDLGRRYTISNVELTTLGARVTASYSGT